MSTNAGSQSSSLQSISQFRQREITTPELHIYSQNTKNSTISPKALAPHISGPDISSRCNFDD
ncbi:hypothetical protein BDV41DRAFT_548066 [Aspergillus transmontanensis]|uniref:Uncharacterized protein n=1 Tax=Aspergillus transmontanensis TaxID=1034304 RepID=A0A5N6VMF5_9EURO|nr:hypothetical protein BDV41DRAFT_548066 [Aspergillus transmontanensis]